MQKSRRGRLTGSELGMDWLPEVSAGQGSALSGFFTALGAILAVVTASTLLSGKVKTIKEAIDETEKHVEDAVANVLSSVKALEEQIGGLSTGLGRVQSDVAGLADSADDAAGMAHSSDDTVDEVANLNQSDRPELRDAWLRIRSELERRANADGLDGRTKASFWRIDRRNYDDLIDKIADARNSPISPEEKSQFKDALTIWISYKNGRKKFELRDLEKLLAIEKSIIKQP
jgi:hypothetical protein